MSVVTRFDTAILGYINSLAGKSHLFDSFLFNLSGSHIVRSIVLLTTYWYFLCESLPDDRTKSDTAAKRGKMLTVLLLSPIALVLARVMAAILPFRARPYYTPSLHLHWPYPTVNDRFVHWSSFPSDHGILFIALATGLYLRNRMVGWLAYLYVVTMILFPRVYLGYHWPTDVIAGALIGIAVGLIALLPIVHRQTERCWDYCTPRYSGAAAAALFLLSYGISTNFDGLRQIGGAILASLHGGAKPG